MASFKFTPSARSGLKKILKYVKREFGPEVAEEVLSKFVDAFHRLAEHPDIGHRRDDLCSEPEIRFWPIGPTLIAYRQRDDDIQLLIVERAESDWSRLLDTTF